MDEAATRFDDWVMLPVPIVLIRIRGQNKTERTQERRKLLQSNKQPTSNVLPFEEVFEEF